MPPTIHQTLTYCISRPESLLDTFVHACVLTSSLTDLLAASQIQLMLLWFSLHKAFRVPSNKKMWGGSTFWNPHTAHPYLLSAMQVREQKTNINNRSTNELVQATQSSAAQARRDAVRADDDDVDNDEPMPDQAAPADDDKDKDKDKDKDEDEDEPTLDPAVLSAEACAIVSL